MYKHMTASGAANLGKNAFSKVKIQVNGALTGTITVSDEAGTAGTPVVAIITNPTVGSVYEFWDLQSGLTVNPSATCDITVSFSGTYGPK